MERLVIAWYGLLSSLTQNVVFGLQAWTDRLEIPLLVAVVLGFIGATSPCQLTTNLGALAYASSRAGRNSPFTLAVAYVVGKVSVYSLVGALAIVAGLQLGQASIPVVVVARKLLGPLMIAVGLSLLGLARVRTPVGQRLALRLRERLDRRGPLGAYLLGVAFSFAFCPTLFWLFFGLTVPLALRSAGGWAFPGAFAIGSALPLLAIAGGLAAGVGTVDRLAGQVGRLDKPLRVVAGVVLIVAGLHDTVVYWML